MCDYSLMHLKSRPAKVGERLMVTKLGTTTGLTGENEGSTAVCLLPGTEIAFDAPVLAYDYGPAAESLREFARVARFRQINVDNPLTHHDALEFPDGELTLLTLLSAGQMATVLQLPAAPRNEQEAKEQTRLEAVG